MTDNKIMHKRQLVDEVARRTGPWGLTRRQVREALYGILDVITDEMAEGTPSPLPASVASRPRSTGNGAW